MVSDIRTLNVVTLKRYIGLYFHVLKHHVGRVLGYEMAFFCFLIIHLEQCKGYSERWYAQICFGNDKRIS